jgi:hydrogenase-4 component B
MDQQLMLLGGFTLLLLGAFVTWVLGGGGWRAEFSRHFGLIIVAAAGGCFASVSAFVLGGHGALGPVVLWQPSLVNASLSIRVDALSAFFLLLISGLSLAAAWFAVGYTRKMADVGGFYPLLLLFVFGMAGVVVVDDFFFFFVPWEFMALSSYLLIVFHREKAENLSAGFKYFFVTHAGTLALFFGITMLVGGGGSSFGFHDMARSMPALLAARPILAHTGLLLILIGFLVKAGCFPFGMWWLPAAHPAAPAPVSALLSGAMIKLGLYGILRVFFQIVPAGPWSFGWGMVVATFGTLSLLVGTLAALVQNDSKRLLAYSSIGQIGYMLLGFGLALGLATSDPPLAAVALVGGLFHMLNHACFKGLLFLNAGTFEMATGERDLNRLGGLNRIVPVTAACAIVASLSIAGLPPFNGFSSKWLIYHASVWGSQGPRVPFLFFGIAALLISAVTLAVMLKFLGASIWGAMSPTVKRATPPREMPWLGSSQLTLAALCLGLGLFPMAGVWLCYLAAAPLAATVGTPVFASLFGAGRFAMELQDRGAVVGVWSPLAVALILGAAFALAIWARRSAGSTERAAATWACGSDVDAEQLRFKAGHYYTPFKSLVRPLLAWPGLAAWRQASARRVTPSAGMVTAVLNPDTWAYNPLVAWMLAGLRKLARSRIGLPQIYPAWNLIGLALSYIFLLLLWR